VTRGMAGPSDAKKENGVNNEKKPMWEGTASRETNLTPKKKNVCKKGTFAKILSEGAQGPRVGVGLEGK